MRSMSATEFKAKCLAVLDDVARTGESIVLLKRGKAIARLVPAPATDARHPQDTLSGSVDVIGDVVSPPLEPHDWEAEGRTRARPRRRRA